MASGVPYSSPYVSVSGIHVTVNPSYAIALWGIILDVIVIGMSKRMFTDNLISDDAQHDIRSR